MITVMVAASDAHDNSKNQADLICDGIADDVEIQSAIGRLPANGGRVVLSEGIFNIAAPIVLSEPAIFVEGVGMSWTDGAATKLKLAAGANCDVFQLDGDGVHRYFGGICQMEIDGNAANQTGGTGNGISILGYFSDYIIRNVCVHDFRNPGNAVMVQPVTDGDCWNFWFLDSLFEGCTGGYGVRFAHPGAAISRIHITGCHFSGNLHGIYSTKTNAYDVYLNDNTFDQNINAGAYIYYANGWKFIGSTFKDNGTAASNTHSGLVLDIAQYAVVVGNRAYNNLVANDQKYGILETGASNNNIIADNMVVGNNTGGISTVGAGTVVRGNMGYIAPGEVRNASGSLTAGVANAICFAWHNPGAQDILVKKVVVEVTTGGGAVGSHLDVGIADDATGTNRGTEFFDDLLLNNVQVDDSWVAGDGGAQTKWVFCQDSASATDGWVVGQILDANAASLVGRYYIEYEGR